ncbi:hypothetical protein Mgra_00000410 [Meloidogyne graminicola]|uniref:Uncharacterized protein n=1 Tax=Meloidogyne graminicola TaxID=189291 RepID=A0A8T0A2B3_9BILA|nr:hypothetical protein Mgra_00000410 [Meloidogyne graminicola]
MPPPSNNPEKQLNPQINIPNKSQNISNNKINSFPTTLNNNQNNSIPQPQNLATKRSRTSSQSPSSPPNKKLIKETTPISTASTSSSSNNNKSISDNNNTKNIIKLPIINLQTTILEFLKIVGNYRIILKELGEDFDIISNEISIPYTNLSNNLLNLEKASQKTKVILARIFNGKEEEIKVEIKEANKEEENKVCEKNKVCDEIEKLNKNTKNTLKTTLPPAQLYFNLLKLKNEVKTYFSLIMKINNNLSRLSTKKAFAFSELIKQFELIKNESSEALNLIKTLFKEEIREKKKIEEV